MKELNKNELMNVNGGNCKEEVWGTMVAMTGGGSSNPIVGAINRAIEAFLFGKTSN